MLRLLSRFTHVACVSICLLGVGLISPPLALAQQSSATINGTVKDSSGAVVEGATITLTNTNTAVTRTSVSNSAGDYVFVDVLPSSYSL